MTPAESLHRLMSVRGLSNPKLAQLAGCAAVEIWRLVRGPEDGGRKISPEWAARLAPHLGVDPAVILFPDEQHGPTNAISGAADLYAQLIDVAAFLEAAKHGIFNTEDAAELSKRVNALLTKYS